MISIFRRFDSDGDDHLSYTDFVSSLVPLKNEKKSYSKNTKVRFDSAYVEGYTPQTKAFTEAQST